MEGDGVVSRAANELPMPAGHSRLQQPASLQRPMTSSTTGHVWSCSWAGRSSNRSRKGEDLCLWPPAN
eukprot:11208629-Lingulodinium_polyedra.AAC.1